MTMPPPPHQPPGPYGPPQQPNPYASHPYPPGQYQQYQQPPPPYAGQAPWGQFPPGPPPRKNRTGLILGIVAASVVGLLVLSYLGNRGSASSGSSSGDFPAASYRLTVPKTLLDDGYDLVEDSSAETNDEMKREGYGDGPDARDTRGIVGSYADTGDEAQSGLAVAGVYGRFKNPTKQRDGLFRGMREADGISEPSPPKIITLEGSDVDLQCTVLLSEDEGTTSTVPVCAWGDENTAAYVAFHDGEGVAQEPDSVDLDATARTVLKVRDDVRQPLR
ncbi:hypothetical protein ACIQ7D_13285 [Streptomyces sp. NPDC096310]|uniref:hypothetical protein n=1 Tax=Streptomyces sp. NPDC096310 TaxID=3366082 RepID=UPI0037FB63F9